MPVLPAVPSTIVPPGRSRPDASASRTIHSAARSFTDWPGVEELCLAVDLASRRLGRAAEADQRRVADGVEDVGGDGHARCPMLWVRREPMLPRRTGQGNGRAKATR